jgi:hypothetical protein
LNASFTYATYMLDSLVIELSAARGGVATNVPRLNPTLLLSCMTSRVGPGLLDRGEYMPLREGVDEDISKLLRKKAGFPYASNPTPVISSSSSSIVMGSFLDAPTRVSGLVDLFEAMFSGFVLEAGTIALFPVVA